MPPRLLPCPDGWTERATARGTPYCDPFPDGVPACRGANAARAGVASCVHVGPSCPESGEPEGLPADRAVVYVRAGAREGRGTHERPFGTIGEAIEVAPEGAIVSIAAGRYIEQIVIDRAIELRGACADSTSIDASGHHTAIEVRGDAEVRLRSLAVSMRYGWAVVAQDHSSVDAEGVRVDPVGVTAFYGGGRSLRVSDAIVRGPGTAVTCYRGECDVRDLSVETTSIAISTGTGTLVGERLTIVSAAVPLGSSSLVSVVALTQGSRTTLRELALPMRNTTIHVAGELEIEQAYLGERAAIVAGTGTMRIRRVYGSRGSRVDAFVSGVIGTFELQDVVFDGGGVVDDENGTVPATWVRDGSVLNLERVAYEGGNGIFVTQVGALHATDVYLGGTKSTDGRGGFALFVQDSAFDATRLAIDRPETNGLLVMGRSRAAVHDLSVQAPRGVFGVAALGGGRIEIERASIEHASTVALLATGENSEVEGTDLAISDTSGFEGEGNIGRAIDVEGGAAIELERVRIARSRGHGVIALGGSSLALRELAMEDTDALSCAATSCPATAYGVGVSAYGSRLSLDRFALRRAALCGVHLAPPADVDLMHGLVAATPIAVCLDDPGYDTRRLSDDVLFVDNGRNLEAVSLPVPPPVPPVETEL